jgi:hypothetical protein
VPKVEREEFVNVGAIVSCPERKYLGCRIEFDEARLLALDPEADLDTIRRNLATFTTICGGGADAGPIGKLAQRERFHWLVATRSTVIQTSPPHSGRGPDPEAVLDHLVDTMVRTPRPGH